MVLPGDHENHWQMANDVMHTFIHPEHRRATRPFFCGAAGTGYFLPVAMTEDFTALSAALSAALCLL